MQTSTFSIDKLTVKVYESRALMGKSAAEEAASAIIGALGKKTELNVIFAAAPSQNEFLAALAQNTAIDWARVNAFHMDEYIGLSPDAPQGFGNFLKERLFGKLPFKSVNYLNVAAADPQAECTRYSGLLKAHAPDIVCMGIGENGHIAFNDPGVALFDDPQLVKIVRLDLKCRQQQVNDGCFAKLDDVPETAMTLTIPALMCAEHVFCMVPGPTKADAVARTVSGDIDEICPATVLRRHISAVLYADRDSAAKISI